MPPKFIGPYRVLETLGSGGVGTVYRALDRRTNDVCALKLLNASPALDARAARRLAREYETLVELSHPNVVRVFDAGVLQGYPYLAMELIEGLTLRHYLELRGADAPSPTPAPRAPFLDGDASDSSDGDDGRESGALESGALESGSDESDSEDGARSRFDLSAFNEESPSEDISHAGAHSLRELADQMDEPDTGGSQDSFELPYELPRPQAPKERPAPKLEELNRPERVGKLKDALLQVCEALAYIHGHGLLHRDLKPSNIMVDEDRQVRLMDFGLAKFVAEDSRITVGGGLVGTFRYMSPEQILGEPMDGRSDLYSLGIILYELLSGRPPFDAQTPDALWTQVLEMEPPPVLSLNFKGDPQLARVTHRLIRKEPDDRFQTAEEVFEALAE